MRRTAALATIVLIFSFSESSGQVGNPSHGYSVRVGSRYGVFDQRGEFRIGMDARYGIPSLGPLEFYPVLDVLVDGELRWQAQANVRIHPLGQHGAGSFWYLGGGLVIRHDETTQGVFSGVALRVRRWEPFFELLFQGPWFAMDGQIELVAGIKMSLH